MLAQLSLVIPGSQGLPSFFYFFSHNSHFRCTDTKEADCSCADTFLLFLCRFGTILIVLLARHAYTLFLHSHADWLNALLSRAMIGVRVWGKSVTAHWFPNFSLSDWAFKLITMVRWREFSGHDGVCFDKLTNLSYLMTVFVLLCIGQRVIKEDCSCQC